VLFCFLLDAYDACGYHACMTRRHPCPACTGEAKKHSRSCPGRPPRVEQPHRPHQIPLMLSTEEKTSLNAYRGPQSWSSAVRCLVKEGTTTKIRPVMAHNTSPNGGECWSEADFATLDLSKGTPHIIPGSSYLSVPIENDAIVRVYCDDGVSNAILIGRRWYWVDASEGGGQ